MWVGIANPLVDESILIIHLWKAAKRRVARFRSLRDVIEFEINFWQRNRSRFGVRTCEGAESMSCTVSSVTWRAGRRVTRSADFQGRSCAVVPNSGSEGESKD